MPDCNAAHSEVCLTAYDEGAIRAAAERALEALHGEISCLFVFATPGYREHLSDLCEVAQVYARCPVVIGCSAWGLIGTGREDEDANGIALLALRLPNTTLSVTAIHQSDVERARDGAFWNSRVGTPAGSAAGWILLGDPFGLDAESLLRGLNEAYPGEPIFGGLASGSGAPGDAYLFTESGRSESGALALGFIGGLRLGGIVSQGCRPVGEEFVVTRADANVLYQIGARGAYEALEETFAALDQGEKRIARQNMLVGLAIDEYGDERGTGDFLVRNILGGDPEAGALAVGALPRVGQTVRFQVRDRDAADAELRRLCAHELAAAGESPFGGLLFSCAARGSHLFRVPNHDAGIVEDCFGKIPLAGLFCNGEIGPVGGRAFLHGYTASLALFYNS